VHVPEKMKFPLKFVGMVVKNPEEIGMLEPAKDAATATSPGSVQTLVTLTGNLVAATVTEVPAGPVEGVRVTVGATIVKLTAGGEAVESEIWIVCAPGRRFRLPAPPIMKYPERAPVTLVVRYAEPDRPVGVKEALVKRPSMATVKVPEVLAFSLTPNPLPVTLTAVPLGPELGLMLAVPAAEAVNVSNGIAIDTSRIIANNETFAVKCVLWFNILFIFYFFS
jgi:hypothetical protein